jgi:hypothetical protein
MRLALSSSQEDAQQFAYLWSLIPLTRAIDTLVITLRNPNSKIGQLLKELHTQYPDFIDWQM